MLQEGIIHKIEKSRDSDQGGEVFSNTMASEESYSFLYASIHQETIENILSASIYML